MATIEIARTLYERGKYDELTEACVELIASQEYAKEARLLWAKAIIQVMGPTDEQIDAQLDKQYQTLITSIAGEAVTLEELFDIEHDLKLTLEYRRLSYAKEYAELCLNKIDIDDWKHYINSTVYFTKQKIYTAQIMRTCGFMRFANQMGITFEELKRQNQPTYEDDYEATDDCRAVIFDCAGALFEKAREFYATNDDCSHEAAEVIIKELLNVLVLSASQYGFVTPKADEGKDELRLETLQKTAEVKDWMLKTVIHYEGKEKPLHNGNRAAEIANLKALYDQILELKHDYVAPELPITMPIITQQPQKSGGCYVATAVYGSYDCPEVWTLRRFRDYTLAETWYGRLFIRTYYAISPTLVKCFGKTKCFRNIFKPYLDKLVARLKGDGVEDTPYNDREW